MKTRFAKSTGCFYPYSENYAELPEDIIEVPHEDYEAAMARNPGDTLDVVDGRVIVIQKPAPTIAEIKAAKWDAMKAERDAIKAGGVKVGTKWYHTDTESRIQHLGLLEKARAARAAGGTDATRLQALGQDIKWKTMDGPLIYITVKHAEDIFAAVTDLDAAAFAAAETHRVAMEASADPAAYDFSVGWPATYAG